MEANFLHDIMLLFRQNKWKEILLLNQNSDSEEARKLLWVWPDENNLNFIKETVLKFGLNGVISLGCGCGLFEWILQQFSGLPIVGYEVNEQWWRSKYCNPQFITLNFPNLPPTEESLNPNFALLFCYFNDGPAFIDYVKCYRGNLVFIIGPRQGAGRHTNPDPFTPDFGNSCWSLHSWQQVKNTQDFIAAYVRS